MPERKSSLRWTPKLKYGKGKCPICLRIDKLVSDHDHETGYNRDGICRACNAGLGMFRDNASALGRAAKYLQHHRKLNEQLTIGEHLLPSMIREREQKAA